MIAPDEGDEVTMKDGRKAIIGSVDNIVWNGGNDWQVEVSIQTDADGESLDVEEEESDIDIRADDAVFGQWKEV